MSQQIPLDVTLELPATEFSDHDSGPMVRCPLNGVWVTLRDYYSEKDGQMLPLVGRASYQEDPEHWIDTGERFLNPSTQQEEAVMKKVPKDDVVQWDAVVRILEAPPYVEPEGGTLNISAADEVGTHDKMLG